MEIISGRKTSTRKKNTPISPMVDLGKLQPQARDLEEAVLGALMLEKDAYSYHQRHIETRMLLRV